MRGIEAKSLIYDDIRTIFTLPELIMLRDNVIFAPPEKKGKKKKKWKKKDIKIGRESKWGGATCSAKIKPLNSKTLLNENKSKLPQL